jgi:Flagellar P-ring protein
MQARFPPFIRVAAENLHDYRMIRQGEPDLAGIRQCLNRADPPSGSNTWTIRCLPPIETVTVTGYAVAQGAVVVGGLQVQGQAQSGKQGVTTSDLIPGGALVEREVPNTLDDLTVIRLALRAPDFGGIAMGSGQEPKEIACGARTRAGTPCRKHPMANGCSQLHGGPSTA